MHTINSGQKYLADPQISQYYTEINDVYRSSVPTLIRHDYGDTILVFETETEEKVNRIKKNLIAYIIRTYPELCVRVGFLGETIKTSNKNGHYF